MILPTRALLKLGGFLFILYGLLQSIGMVLTHLLYRDVDPGWKPTLTPDNWFVIGYGVLTSIVGVGVWRFNRLAASMAVALAGYAVWLAWHYRGGGPLSPIIAGIHVAVAIVCFLYLIDRPVTPRR